MVVPLLIAALAGASPPPSGILLTSPRPANALGIGVMHQQNWERRRPVLGASISASWALGLSTALSVLHRNLATSQTGEERFDLYGVEMGWWCWRSDHGAPIDLGLAGMWTDSTFDVVRDSLHHHRSGERTASVLLRATRRVWWAEPGSGLLWTNRFFKGRRERLDDFAGCLTLRLHAGSWPLSVLGEWCPWIANPDRRTTAWSASVSVGHAPGAPLTVFATNTYGSTLANITGTIPDVVWGARVSVGWEFLRPAD